MPRTKFDKQPPMDRLKGLILERKMALHLTWDDVAKSVPMSGDSLRKLAKSKHTDDWKPEVRRKVCRTLGLKMETVVKMDSEDGGIRI